MLYTDGLLDQLAKGQEDDVQQLQARLGENGEQLEDHVLNLFEGLGQVSQQDDICLVMVETKAKA